MDTVFVKPRPGCVVRMPERDFWKLPAEGGNVPLDAYWQARLRDGDVTRADPPAVDPDQASPAPSAPSKKKS